VDCRRAVRAMMRGQDDEALEQLAGSCIDERAGRLGLP
jgi:hypothetical protein